MVHLSRPFVWCILLHAESSAHVVEVRWFPGVALWGILSQSRILCQLHAATQLAASGGVTLSALWKRTDGRRGISWEFSGSITHKNTHNWSCVYDRCIIYQLVSYYLLHNNMHMNHNNFMLQCSSEKTHLIFSQLIGLAHRHYELKRHYLRVCVCVCAENNISAVLLKLKHKS